MPAKTLIPTNTPFRLMPTKSKLDNNEAAGTLKQCCCWQCPPTHLGPFSLTSSLTYKLFCVFTAHSRMGTQPQAGWGDHSPTVLLPSHLSQAELHLLSCCCPLPGTSWDAGISKLQHGKADSLCHKHSLRNSLGCCRKSREKKLLQKFLCPPWI